MKIWLEERRQRLLLHCCFFSIPYIWAIWIKRNKAIFDRSKVNPKRAITVLATQNANAYFSAIQQKRNKAYPTNELTIAPLVTLLGPPNHETLSRNSTDLKSSKGVYAVNVRDEYWSLLTVVAKKFPCCSSLEAEARAVKEAILLEISLCLPFASVHPFGVSIRSSPVWALLGLLACYCIANQKRK